MQDSTLLQVCLESPDLAPARPSPLDPKPVGPHWEEAPNLVRGLEMARPGLRQGAQASTPG